MKLIPIGSRVILERLEETEVKTAGGIIIPENSVNKFIGNKGRILAIGKDEDGNQIKTPFKVNDVVYFDARASVNMTLCDTGENITLINFTNLFCIDPDAKKPG